MITPEDVKRVSSKPSFPLSFEEWFETVRDDVEENCENRMDRFDAREWMREAWDARYENLSYKQL